MSSYVKYIHQCDICECALDEETHTVDDAPVKYPTKPPGAYGLDACAECMKEVHNAIETLKTVMQVKRSTTEPAEEVRFTKKEWGEIYAKQTAQIAEEAKARAERDRYQDYGMKGSGMSSEKARYIMDQMRKQAEQQKEKDSIRTMPARFG